MFFDVAVTSYSRRWAGGKGDVVTKTIHAEDNPNGLFLNYTYPVPR